MTQSKMKTKEKKLVKLLKGVAKTLELLAEEIENDGFDTDRTNLLAEIGAKLLFEAKAFTFRS